MILKISSLKDRCRQWLRVVPGTRQYFWQKDSKEAYFWYWKSRQRTVQVSDSSQPASPDAGSPHRAWSWPPRVDRCPSLALTRPCPQRCPMPRAGAVPGLSRSLAGDGGTGSRWPGPALKNIKLNRSQNTRTQILYLLVININFKKCWLTSQVSCAFT